MRIKPLPPLNSLIAFEAAARHLSFTRAAEDLYVTQGAISRQVRHLEEFLGQALFIRDKRSLQLTTTGSEYYQEVQRSLQTIASATGKIVQKEDDKQVTIITSNAMASFWLLPKIKDFHKTYPDINIRLLAVDSIDSALNDDFDIALFYCRTPPADLEVMPLFSETVFPVCSPGYLESLPDLKKPEDLIQGTLLALEVNEEWVNWQDLFRESGISYVQEDYRRININNYPLVIQAALNGQGLALAWNNLVDDYINSGLLVRPINMTMVTTAQFYMLQPTKSQYSKPSVDCFKKWLLSMVKDNTQTEL